VAELGAMTEPPEGPAKRAEALFAEYGHRTGTGRHTRAYMQDASYRWQVDLLWETLSRLETILQDEGVPPEITERVIRGMLYGSPSPADAEQRLAMVKEMTDLMNRAASKPVLVPGMGERMLLQALRTAGRRWTFGDQQEAHGAHHPQG
jgi:hypothetical protein